MSNPPNMLKAALWYARRGDYIFPVHNAIFDNAGNCIGCTCEPWKRTQPEYGPRFTCDQPGKCPHVAWRDKSTIDLNQIRQWWKWWPNANIGVDMGKSGKIAFDKDLYKANYAGDSLTIEEDTITSRTGGGGIHLWYQMPEGKAYGNATGNLPEGIDVRGAGGYIVVPPSLHHSGRRYEFVAGHSPADLDALPLPQFLIDILEAAQAKSDAVPVNFTAGIPPMPDLAQWSLADATSTLIRNGHPAGADRSSLDYKVIRALVRAGATDDEIRAVFTHFPIGAKYDERGDKYLARSIGKARAWLLDHPPDPPAAMERLCAARQWVRSPSCLARLRAFGVRRVADLVPLLDAIVEMAQARRTSRVVTTLRDLADRCAIAASTAHRRLAKVGDAGLLTMQPDQYGTLIDLSNLLDLSGTLPQNVQSVPLGSTSSDDFIADHRGDDAFTSYPYWYAVKRRGNVAPWMASLGAAGLLLWDALHDGGTVNELAEATGLTVASVRATLKRFLSLGLLVIWEEGRSKWYELHPNAWDRLEERREHMVTAGIGQLRAARNANDRASFAQHQLQGRMPLEPRQRAKLEVRRDKADTKAAAHYDSLLAMGIDPRAKVRQCPPRHRIRIDHGEEWVSIHRPIYEQWQLLSPLPYAERFRMMLLAGFTRREIDDAKRMAGKVGRGPRHFVGVGEQREAVAA